MADGGSLQLQDVDIRGVDARALLPNDPMCAEAASGPLLRVKGASNITILRAAASMVSGLSGPVIQVDSSALAPADTHAFHFGLDVAHFTCNGVRRAALSGGNGLAADLQSPANAGACIGVAAPQVALAYPSSIRHSVFTNASAEFGGALGLGVLAASLHIDNVSMTNNRAEYHGGALYVGQALRSASLVIANSRLAKNVAAKQGGAVYLGRHLGAVVLRSVSMIGNAAGSGGGVMSIKPAYLELGANATLDIINCTAVNNSAVAGNGGVLHLDGDWAGRVQMFGGTELSGNAAGLDPEAINLLTGAGGAVHVDGRLSGAIILRASRALAGSAAYGALVSIKGVVDAGASIQLSNSTVGGMAAGQAGGVIWVSGDMNGALHFTDGAAISDCLADVSGGVVSLAADLLGSIRFNTGARVSGCGAGLNGSVIHIGGASSAASTIEVDSSVWGSSSAGSHGGCAYVAGAHRGSILFTNATVSACSSRAHGGVLHFAGGMAAGSAVRLSAGTRVTECSSGLDGGVVRTEGDMAGLLEVSVGPVQPSSCCACFEHAGCLARRPAGTGPSHLWD